MATFQFMRIKGFPRGSNRTKKSSTLNSVLSEGRRVPTFSRHVKQPDIRVTCIDRQFESIVDYQRWIEKRMYNAQIPMVVGGTTHYRGIRKDAVAIGTIIISLPSRTEETSVEKTDNFKNDSIPWVKKYLNSRGMSLDYCVEHYDEEYPHLHFWFTPDDTQTQRNVWYLGDVANPKLKERNLMRTQYFTDVGHKYFDRLEKDKQHRIKRQPSRYLASQQRLPAGVPEQNPSNMFGFPVSNSETTPRNQLTSIEESSHFMSAVKQLLITVLESRRVATLLSDEEHLDRLFVGSLLSQQTIQRLTREVLSARNDEDLFSNERAFSPEADRDAAPETVLGKLARGNKFEPPRS